MLIQARLEFKDDPAAVWGRLSDVERIPEFWHGTRSLRDHREGSRAGRVVKARGQVRLRRVGEG